MVETEKITVNMNVVDLGKVDLLVSQGFYSNRTDFIRSSIRNQIATHAKDVENIVVRKSFNVGVTRYGRKELEELLASNEKVEVNVVGLLIIDEDVDVDLAVNTIESLQVKGVFKANLEVKKALIIYKHLSTHIFDGGLNVYICYHFLLRRMLSHTFRNFFPLIPFCECAAGRFCARETPTLFVVLNNLNNDQ